jgi:hypothetical protein
MDPNEALRLIRQICRDVETDDEKVENWDELVNLIEGLDQWISKGGFLPKDWERK